MRTRRRWWRLVSRLGERATTAPLLSAAKAPAAHLGRPADGRSPPSALRLVLLVPQRVVEIEDTLTEGAAARGDADIGTGQTRLLPSGLIGALDGIGALGASCGEQCGKGAN